MSFKYTRNLIIAENMAIRQLKGTSCLLLFCQFAGLSARRTTVQFVDGPHAVTHWLSENLYHYDPSFPGLPGTIDIMLPIFQGQRVMVAFQVQGLQCRYVCGSRQPDYWVVFFHWVPYLKRAVVLA